MFTSPWSWKPVSDGGDVAEVALAGDIGMSPLSPTKRSRICGPTRWKAPGDADDTEQQKDVVIHTERVVTIAAPIPSHSVERVIFIKDNKDESHSQISKTW